MMNGFSEIFDGFADPSMRHAILGHMPIALGVLVIPLTIVSALLPGNRTLRMTAIAAFAILLVATLLTVNSGEAANAAINRELSPDVYALVEEHEEMAEKSWLFAVAGLVCMIGAELVKRRSWRIGATGAAAAVAIAGASWTAVTAHHGGTLVYAHGVGTKGTFSSADTEPIARNPVRNADESLFRDQVLPILKSHCFQCHNPAKVAAKKSGGFDQTTRDALMKGGVSGPAVVPGDPDGSLLIQRVRGDDPDERLMPPPPDDPLTAEQIAILEQWIRDGAVWE